MAKLSSFVAVKNGIITIAAGLTVTSSLLEIAMFATPVGWVVAIGIGLTVGYFAAVTGDVIGRSLATEAYDLVLA
ncbi:hypothetical protein [Agarivorans sp. QJM3NY_25]|uniref:hypothetical protein n=1 Tax=Agarivorans sp. QJM3NY_25 TaxID=3421430 RepID=UPI003D7C5ED1